MLNRPRTKKVAWRPLSISIGALVLATALPAGVLLSVSSASATSGASSVPLGDYAGNNDPSGVAAFGAATGTHPTLASDYLDGSSGWSTMAAAGNLSAWPSSGYRLVLGVPIIPDGTGGTLAAGATGSYNSYFVTLAQNLVHEGLSNAILRLGWEFNGNWYNWSVANSTDAANFAAYWRQIVTSMRSVAGQQFQFAWNPNGSGPTNYTPDQAYPGSAYVDYIGTDIYDNCWCSPQTPQNAWSAQLSQAWGLNWLASFAAEQGKPIAFPEWSDDFRSDGHGLGDDPYFINQFAAWIASNNVAFTNIFAFDGPGQQNDITDGSFPNALAAFKADFGGGPVVINTPTTVAPTTTTTKAQDPPVTVAPTTTTTKAQDPPVTVAPTTTTTKAPSKPSGTAANGTPTAPTDVTVSVSGSTVTVGWVNGTMTFGDDVFRDGQEIAWPGWPSPVATVFQDTDVPPGTHTYYVAAYNSAGVGAPSTSVTVTVGNPTAGSNTPTGTSRGGGSKRHNR